MDFVASKILKSFLKTFIESCSDWGTGNDVEITPSQGIVTLHDIVFIREYLQEMILLPSELEITTATCSSIDVVVPWTHLYSKPILLKVGNVIVKAKSKEKNENDENQLSNEMKEKHSRKEKKNSKPKKKKEKKGRELIDTILVEINQFKLELTIGESTLYLDAQGGMTYFADENFNKLDRIKEDIIVDDIIWNYRYFQLTSLDMMFQNGERIVSLCNNLRVDGKYITQRLVDGYKLMDTKIMIDLSGITLNLSMDDYINLVNYIKTFFSIATQSAILDVVNADDTTSQQREVSQGREPIDFIVFEEYDESVMLNNSQTTTPRKRERNNSIKISNSSQKSYSGSLSNSVNSNQFHVNGNNYLNNSQLSPSTPVKKPRLSASQIQPTKSNPISVQPISSKTISKSMKNGNSLSKSTFVTSNTYSGSLKTSSSLKRSAISDVSDKSLNMSQKKLEKLEKKTEKKLQKIEKKGEPKTSYIFSIAFMKLSLKNEEIDEGLCWIIGDMEMTFVPAYGGRIKEGMYGFSIGTIEGIYNMKDDMKRLVWGLPRTEYDPVLKANMFTKWNRDILLNTRFEAELNFLGITMEFEMLKNLIEFVKITVIDKLSELDVSMLSMKERMEQTIESAKNIWNETLNILGLGGALDLLKRIDIDLKFNKCEFEGPFPNKKGLINVRLDDVAVSNQHQWNDFNIDEIVQQKLKREFERIIPENPKEINIGITLGSFSIQLKDAYHSHDLFPSTSASLRGKIIFDDITSTPSMILSQLYINQIKFTMTHTQYRNIYEYFSQIKHFITSQVGGTVSDFGNKISETVKENKDDLTSTTMTFIDESVIPTFSEMDLPAIIFQMKLDGGHICVPITSIVQRHENGGNESMKSIMEVNGLQMCIGIDNHFRSVGIFLENVFTKELEQILSPFNGIIPKNNSDWISTEEDPSVSFIWKYDKTVPESDRIMSMNLTLFNVQVLLNNLFGVKLDQTLSTMRSEIDDKKQGKLPSSGIDNIDQIDQIENDNKEKKEDNQEENSAFMSWIQEKYKGMSVTLNISECELVAEDHLHKATVSSASPYAKQAEGIVYDLVNELEQTKQLNEQLEEKKRLLILEIEELENELKKNESNDKGLLKKSKK